MQFHARMGHLSLYTIERMAKTPGSGVENTDHKRTVCKSRKVGKQLKNRQSQIDSGMHDSIDRIGGVI